MPSVPERLATLEAGFRRLDERCDQILELLEGDGSDEGWKRSVRGRLHTILDDLATSRALAYAAEQVEKAAAAQRAATAEQRRERSAGLATWLQVIIAACVMLLTAAGLYAAWP